MNKLVCVLRSGGEFTLEHVHALWRNATRCLTVPFEFQVLTASRDISEFMRLSLLHDWPGWWSKLELFRPGLFRSDDRVVYTDLDTVMVGNVDWLFDFEGPFVMLRGFSRNRWASGLMAWDGEPPSQPYFRFRKKEVPPLAGGDQEFIYRSLRDKLNPGFWQDQFPGGIHSYKRSLLVQELGEKPPQNSVICFHGSPRPWNVNAAWIEEARA